MPIKVGVAAVTLKPVNCEVGILQGGSEGPFALSAANGIDEAAAGLR